MKFKKIKINKTQTKHERFKNIVLLKYRHNETIERGNHYE